jgi:DnaK suppressor protein
MDETELTFFKEQLSQWLDDLRHKAEDTISGMRDADTLLADPLDRAIFDTENNFKLRIRFRETVLINKIRQSLEDIGEGEYGICQSCGEDISIARLKARLIARHCINCKTKMEQHEKLTEL